MTSKITPETSDVRVSGFEPLITPAAAAAEFPLTETASKTVLQGRHDINEALAGRDKRMVVIAGPCSIHDPKSAMEYARNLAALKEELADQLILVMRVYFEKPRTTVGWKGYIYDPGCDESHDMNRGLREARELLQQINELGLPCATEFLDPIVPQYTSDLVTWAAIGARTTESQTHRQMASGLSMPVGFKNATDGELQVALDAMASAAHGQAFLGIDGEGQTCIVRTRGNPNIHLVLRGGGGKSNYSKAHVAYTRVKLEETNAQPRSILVDCSHANSNKDYSKQPGVFREVLTQISDGQESILGVMLESHLVEGKQKLGAELTYGQSITDGCISWEQTEKLLREAHGILD
jgi:3-deoxy-7-phosphoheptulonate synthase